MYMNCYYSAWSIVTFAVLLTVSEIQAVLMLKTTFLPTTVVFDLEFEGHAVEMWRQEEIWSHQKARVMGLPYGE